jgi:hypothetical protein
MSELVKPCAIMCLLVGSVGLALSSITLIAVGIASVEFVPPPDGEFKVLAVVAVLGVSSLLVWAGAVLWRMPEPIGGRCPSGEPLEDESRDGSVDSSYVETPKGPITDIRAEPDATRDRGGN